MVRGTRRHEVRGLELAHTGVQEDPVPRGLQGCAPAVRSADLDAGIAKADVVCRLCGASAKPSEEAKHDVLLIDDRRWIGAKKGSYWPRVPPSSTGPNVGALVRTESAWLFP